MKNSDCNRIIREYDERKKDLLDTIKRVQEKKIIPTEEDLNRWNEELEKLEEERSLADKLIEDMSKLLLSRKKKDKELIYNAIKKIVGQDGFRVEEKTVTRVIERENAPKVVKVRKTFFIINDELEIEREFKFRPTGDELLCDVDSFVPNSTSERIYDEIGIQYQTREASKAGRER